MVETERAKDIRVTAVGSMSHYVNAKLHKHRVFRLVAASSKKRKWDCNLEGGCFRTGAGFEREVVRAALMVNCHLRTSLAAAVNVVIGDGGSDGDKCVGE